MIPSASRGLLSLLSGVALVFAASCDSGEAGPAAATGMATGKGTGTGKVCAAQADCAVGEVCYGTTARYCGADLPRTYRVILQKATDFNSFGSDGKPWDSDGSGPDPYATISLSVAGGADKILCQTAVIGSTDSPAWSHSCTVALSAGADLTFAVWDEDGASDAEMLQVPFKAEEIVKILRDEGGAGQAKSTARLWFKVEAP